MIAKLTASYFRGLKNAQIDLEENPVTLVLGPNGAGKSSLAGAIEWCLTGACQWTTKAGAGYANLISHDSIIGSELTLDTDKGQIIRQITPKGCAVGFEEREGKDAVAQIEGNFPETSLLLAMLRSDGLIGLPAKEQQDLLFALAGGETDADWFRKQLTTDEQAILEEELVTRIKGSALGEKLYKAAYAIRTVANKSQKDAAAKLAAFAFPTPGEAADPDALGQQAQALRVTLGGLQQQIGAAQSQATAHAQAATRQQKAKEDVQRYQTALDALQDVGAPSDDVIASLEGVIEKQRHAYTEAIGQASAASATRESRQEQLDQFVKLGGKCVLGDTPCAMDEETRGKLIRKEQAEIDKLEEVWKKASTAADAAAKAGDEGRKLLEAAKQKQTTAASVARDRERLTDELDRAKESLKATVTEAKQAGQADVTALQAQAAELQGQIADLEDQQRTARQQQNAVAEEARLKQEARDAEAFAKTVDTLVKKLDADGLPAQAMRETLGPVLDGINGVLGEFTDFTLSAEPGKDFALNVERGGRVTPVFCLSEGEGLMVGAAIQVAFAKLTGFGFCVVDAADRLDGGNRGALIGMLLDSGIRALVLATPANGVRPQAEGLSVYELQDGAAVAL